MEKEDILKIITDVLSDEFEKEKEAFKIDSDIKKTLELDSLSIVDLVSILEEEFDIKIDMKDVKNIATFGNLVDYIYNKKN